jgi:hypothetical protein
LRDGATHFQKDGLEGSGGSLKDGAGVCAFSVKALSWL